jgi:ElaB/YqjD/DUF883 family membrane-anchored ribosome-binding protein
MQEKTGNGHSLEVEQFLADLKAVVRDGQELLRVGLKAVQEQARAGAQSTERFARERPYETLGIAFAVGLLVGMLASGSLGGKAGREEETED